MFRKLYRVEIFTCITLMKAGLVMVHPSLCPSAALLGCQVCVIRNFKSFNSFIFKLCIKIAHTLKCASAIQCTIYEYTHILRVLNLDIFSSKMLRWCLVCVICNSTLFIPLYTNFAKWLFTHRKCAPYFCTHLIYIILFLRAVELRHSSIQNALGVSGWCNL